MALTPLFKKRMGTPKIFSPSLLIVPALLILTFTFSILVHAALSPRDLDGDGLYEDVNGNGRLDFDDAVTLALNLDKPEIANSWWKFDFNSNGRQDFDDAVNLAFMVGGKTTTGPKIINFKVPQLISLSQDWKMTAEICDDKSGWKVLVDYGDGQQEEKGSSSKCKTVTFKHRYATLAQKDGVRVKSYDILLGVVDSDGLKTSTLKRVPIFQSEIVAEEVLVKFKGGVSINPVTNTTNSSAINSLIKDLAIKDLERAVPEVSVTDSFSRLVKLTLSDAKTKDIKHLNEVLKRFRNNSQVEYAEPNYIFQPQFIPKDTYFSRQWALSKIQAIKAWDIEKGDKDVVIAVVDSGVDWQHPDLVNSIWTNTGEIPNNGVDDDGNGFKDDVHGWDFVDAPEKKLVIVISPIRVSVGLIAFSYCTPGINQSKRGDCQEQDNDPTDNFGHGTHVAGIIAASTNNAKGIAGICPNCKIMPLKAGFSDGFNAYHDLRS